MAKRRAQVQDLRDVPRLQTIQRIADTFAEVQRPPVDTRLGELGQALGLAARATATIAEQQVARAKLDARAQAIIDAQAGRARDLTQRFEGEGLLPQGITPWYQAGVDEVRATRAAQEFKITADRLLEERGLNSNPDANQEEVKAVLLEARQIAFGNLGPISNDPAVADKFGRVALGFESGVLSKWAERNRVNKVNQARDIAFRFTTATALELIQQQNVPPAEMAQQLDAALTAQLKNSPLTPAQLSDVKAQAMGASISRLLQSDDPDQNDLAEELLDTFFEMKSGTGPLFQTNRGDQVLNRLHDQFTFSAKNRESKAAIKRAEDLRLSYTAIDDRIRAGENLSRDDLMGMAAQNRVPAQKLLAYYKSTTDFASDAEVEIHKQQVGNFLDRMANPDTGLETIREDYKSLARYMTEGQRNQVRAMLQTRGDLDTTLNADRVVAGSRKRAQDAVTGKIAQLIKARATPSDQDPTKLVPNHRGDPEFEQRAVTMFNRFIYDSIEDPETDWNRLSRNEKDLKIQDAFGQFNAWLEENQDSAIEPLRAGDLPERDAPPAPPPAEAEAAAKRPVITQIARRESLPFVFKGRKLVVNTSGKYDAPAADVLDLTIQKLDEAEARARRRIEETQNRAGGFGGPKVHRVNLAETLKLKKEVNTLREAGVSTTAHRYIISAQFRRANIEATQKRLKDLSVLTEPTQVRRLQNEIKQMEKEAASLEKQAGDLVRLFPEDAKQIQLQDPNTFKFDRPRLAAIVTGQEKFGPKDINSPFFRTIKDLADAERLFNNDVQDSPLWIIKDRTGWTDKQLETFTRHQGQVITSLTNAGLMDPEELDPTTDDDEPTE